MNLAAYSDARLAPDRGAFRPDPVQGVRMMEGLAIGDVTETEFAAWIEQGMSPI